MPKTVIEGLQQQLAMPEYLKQVCLIGLALAAAKVLNELLTFVMQTQTQNMRGFYGQESVRTSAKMDYEILATKSTLEKMNMAFTATLGDRAITAQFAVIKINKRMQYSRDKFLKSDVFKNRLPFSYYCWYMFLSE